ncbi:MAG: protoporphyrinogen oxidase, partial [Xanthomonadales bacterium]|nr:protoporphyrinogen oxidase [Xanthomonadales bacterium]
MTQGSSVAIIGGGISGLTTAFYLKQLKPNWEITLFEKQSAWGGTMRTETVDGFLFETGSNGFLSSKPYTMDLVRDSGAEDLLMRSEDVARKRFVFTDRLHRLPESPPAFIKTPLLSWKGKLRVLGEFFVPASKNPGDETLKQFGDRRLGSEFTDVFLNAMSAGIFGSQPEDLSVAAAFPLVVRLEQEHGGLFRGMLAKRRKEAGPGGVLMSFTGGVSTFIEHLVGRIPGEHQLGVGVESIAAEGGRYRLRSGRGEAEFDKVVLATPAFVASQLVRDLDEGLAGLLDQIRYAPISLVGFGYESVSHDLDGFGLLTTRSAGRQVLGVLWDSSIFPDRAPDGRVSLRAMIGGMRQPELAMREPAELIRMAREDIETTMGITEDPIT